jgi:hypothetical protein
MSREERIDMLRTRLECAEGLDDVARNRPKTRAECNAVPRPCPYVGCRYNLYLDVDELGRIIIPDADTPIEERRYSCALDVVEDNPDGIGVVRLATLTGHAREELKRIEVRGRDAMAVDAVLAEAHGRGPDEAEARRARRRSPARVSPVASGDLRTRLELAVREKAILDALADGPKTTAQIAAALEGTEQQTSAWNVRHVLRVLRARELVSARSVPVEGQDSPVLEWRLLESS